MKKVISLVVFFVLLLGKAEGLEDITATGGWTRTITTSDLISGAGSNLQNTYTSVSNATVLTLTSSGAWRVDVQRTDTSWRAEFTLSAQRTSNGTGSGTISGGQSYIAVTAVAQEFFRGTFNRNNVNAQYRLAGMSVTIPPATYTTTVTFTIVTP
jgi:hypothetical protein